MGQVQVPLPRVFTDHALDDFQKVFICRLRQTISSRIIWRGSWANNVIFLAKPENLFQNERSSIVANNLERDTEVGENVVL